MEENKNKIGTNSAGQKNVTNIDTDAIKNLAENLLKDQKSINMASLMGMASNLLQDKSLMGMVKDIGKAAPPNENAAEKQLIKTDENEIEMLRKEINELTGNLKMISNELNALKEKNVLLENSILEIGKSKKKKEKKKDKKK